LAEVTQGGDPAAARDRARRAADIAALAARFIDDPEPNLAPNTTKEYRRILSCEIEHSILGRVPAQNLTRADVREFLEAIARRAPVSSSTVGFG
jgi:hypothetical protein